MVIHLTDNNYTKHCQSLIGSEIDEILLVFFVFLVVVAVVVCVVLLLLSLIPETYIQCLVKIGSVMDEMLLLLLLLLLILTPETYP